MYLQIFLLIIFIAVPPSNIKIANKTKWNTIELMEERSSEITCSVSNGIPSAQLAFSIDGNFVKNRSDDLISLRIKGTQIFHMKPIKCTANHSFLENPLEDAAVLIVLSEYKMLFPFQLFDCE